MSCLLKSEYSGTITWLGRVLTPEDSIKSEALNTVETTFDGIVGESHSGATRPSCLRVTMLHPKSTEIGNTRQLSILSAEENAEIAASIGLEQLDPSWLGASIVISGVPDFTHIPPGSRLQTAAGTTLTVDLENAPCNWPAKEIEADCPGHGKAFRSAAKGRRGITAWVERPGPLSIGDTVNLFIPTQRIWQPK
jgi:MOSC domain-containing protein YiiM